MVFRRVARHPIARTAIRSGEFIQKRAIRGAALGIVPAAVNDVAFHHAQICVDEFIHVMQDTAAVTSMETALAVTILVLARFARD